MDNTTNPLDMLWRPAALMATILGGEALALILVLGSAQPVGGGLVQFGLTSLAIQWVALGTLALMWLLRRPLSRLPPSALAWSCLGLLLAMTLMVSLLAWETLSLTGAIGQPMTGFVLRMLALALVVGMIGLIGFQNYWAARRLAIRTKQLELESLQTRIRPHFLFNTLNTGAALVHVRPDDAERVLLDLADLFRHALQQPQLIPLSEELDLTRRYLEIESLRFGERLVLDWNLPEALPDALVPSLSIQPLAENAIRHGIERRAGGGRVDLSVRVEAGWLCVAVGNDLPEDAEPLPGHAVGLASTRERVQAFTDGRGRMEAGREGERFVARIRLPLDAKLLPYPTTS